MLDVSHVTKKYGKVTACNDVSFHLDPGSVTVLLGPNGAGKSTIMKSIIGFLRYDGEITVGGFPNKTTDARRLLGYIPEMPSLYPNLTASEHMEFLARAYRLTDYKQRVDELFDRFELEDISHLNVVSNYYEHSELTEGTLNQRAILPTEPMEEGVYRKILSDQLHTAISKLPAIQRRRLLLYYFGEFTYEQIAQMEGCTKRAVKFSVDIAIQKLKESF